jgi:membrane associated rhomboid family serine protease
MKAKWFMLIFAGIELVTGVTGTPDGVAHFAHLGGMLFGWLLMLWWRKTGRIYERDNWI